MALQNPVAIYNAATNVEAQLVKLRLVEAGVEAYVSEDCSPGGLWMFGTLPEIHKPQVWTSRCSSINRARSILQEYVDEVAPFQIEQVSETCRRSDNESKWNAECHTRSLFPATQRGSVQDCPACGAFS